MRYQTLKQIAENATSLYLMNFIWEYLKSLDSSITKQQCEEFLEEWRKILESDSERFVTPIVDDHA